MLRANNLIGFGAGAGGGGAAPVVEARSVSQKTADNSTLTLPSGIVAGDLILVLGSSDGVTVSTFEAGYTERWNAILSSEFGFHAYAKVAAGGETTADVTLSSAVDSIWEMYRISGASGTSGVEKSAASTAVDASPDPPSFSPSWGSKPTLWIPQCHIAGGSITTAPTDYTNLLTAVADHAGATAERQLTAASEDAGAFTASASAEWEAIMVAVEPA